MASLKQAAEQLTNQLEELVGRLRKELTNGEVDFVKLGDLADEISERADGLAETFGNVNDAFQSRLDQLRGGGKSGGDGGGGGGGGGRSQSRKRAGSRQGGGGSGGDSSGGDSE